MSDAPYRLLIVVNRPDVVTAIVRAEQYRDWFARSARFRAEFHTRIPRWLVRLMQSWPRRRGLRWVGDRLERTVMAWSDRRIRRAGRDADIVYAVTMPDSDLQAALMQQGATYVMDIIDGLWLPWFRQFGWDDLEPMLASAHGVICASSYTAEYVQRYQPDVELVPDSPQLDVFDRAREIRSGAARDAGRENQVVIGWIGGKDSVDALYVVYEVLERLFAEYPQLHLRILGPPREYLPRFENVRFSLLSHYDQQTMVREALELDIGIYPQFHVQESLHRGLKPKIYMSAGVATVCERLGESTRLIRDGENGLLAAGAQQWEAKLRWLIESPAERQRIGAAGLQTIREQFTVEKCFARLCAALEAIHLRRRQHAVGESRR